MPSWSTTRAVVLAASCLALWATTARATDHSGACDGTWAAADNPHVIVGGCSVPALATLTIEAGAVVQASAPDATLSVSGTLEATGATFTNVRFGFGSGSVGSIQASNLTTAPGWPFLGVSNASVDLMNNTISGLYPSGFGGPVQYSGASTGTIQGNSFVPAASGGVTTIEVSGTATLTIADNEFFDRAGTGETYVSLNVGAASDLTITDNTFRASGDDRPMVFGGNTIAATLAISGNEYPTGAGAGHFLGGSLGVSASLFEPDGYELTLQGLTVQSPATLTVPAGVSAMPQSVGVDAGATLSVASGAELSRGSVQVYGAVYADSATLTQMQFVFRSGSVGSIQASSLSPPLDSLGAAVRAESADVDLLDNTITVSGNTNPFGIIQYAGTSTGTISENTFSASGSSAPLVIAATGSASPLISGNEFLDNPGGNQTLVQLDVSAPSAASVTGNVFRASGGDVPISLHNAAIALGLTTASNSYPSGSGAGNLLYGNVGGSPTLGAIDGQPTLASLTLLPGAMATIDAAAPPLVSAITVNAGAALSVPAGTLLRGAGAGGSIGVLGAFDASGATLELLTITTYAGGTTTLDRVAGSGLVFSAAGSLTIADSNLTLAASLAVDAGGVLDLLRTRLGRSVEGALLVLTSATGTIAENVFERTTASTGILLSGTSGGVTLAHNEFRVSGAHWFTQRAARYLAAAVGSGHVCGVLASGEVRCAGADTDGQATPPLIVARRLAAGATHTCALLRDDRPVCWGSPGDHTSLPATRYRRLAAGNGFTCGIRSVDDQIECFPALAEPPPSGRFRELVAGREAGEEFVCALGYDARVTCWGTSSYGADSPLTRAFAEISAGDRHVCARRFDDMVECWGDDTSGQYPAPSGEFVDLASGSLHTCGKRADGTVDCWGANDAGQSTAPAQLFHDVVAGGTQSCGRTLDEALVCWGSAEELTTTLSSVGEVLVGLGSDHACNTTAGFGLSCWGDDTLGQATPPAHPAFAQVAGGSGFGCASHGANLFSASESFGFDCWGSEADASGKATPHASARFGAALGLSHGCALAESGSAVCWGDDTFGQAAPPANTFRALAAGTRHTCGVTDAGTIDCWGSSADGRTSEPPGLYTRLAAGPDHSCALRRDGEILCWGLDDLGQATALAGPWKDVAAGDVFSCGLRTDGEVECWGSDADNRRNPPPGPFVRLDAGTSHACAVRANGAIACWGAPLGSPAPNDLDLDGITDGGDNCPVDANFTQADGELDGTGDLCDNCPVTYAADQDDLDGDLVGDACDNCASVINPGQEDADLNGFGDACEDAAVILRYVPPPPPPGPPGLMPPPAPGDQEYDIFVSCGTLPIQRVELGVILPQGTLTEDVSFGPGCTSTTCAAATGLGATVNATASRALGPGLATPGTRPDSVYFSLVGSGPPDNRLCSPFQEVQAGRFVLANAPIAPPVPNLTTEGLAPLGLVPLTDAFNRVMLPEEYGFVAQDATPVLGLSLQPALHDTTGRKWQVELAASIALNRVTFGLVAPAGTTTAQMRFSGCTTLSGSPETRRICAANAALGAYVAPATSFTVGPGAATSGLRGDTLYVSLGGSLASGAPLPVLNAAQQPTLLGVVELDTTTLQPALTADGLGATSVFGTPFVDVSGLAVPAQAVQIAGGYNAPSDYDADARSDDLDNCPFTANNDQADRGGLATVVPNGRGDRCECGEATDDGAIFAADAAVIRDLLAGKAIVSPVLARDRCSVSGTPGCDVADVAIVRRSLAGFGPFPLAACTSAVR